MNMINCEPASDGETLPLSSDSDNQLIDVKQEWETEVSCVLSCLFFILILTLHNLGLPDLFAPHHGIIFMLKVRHYSTLLIITYNCVPFISPY
jgi:hypothetical protein